MSFKNEWRKIFFMFVSLIVFLILNTIISPPTSHKLKQYANKQDRKKIIQQELHKQQKDEERPGDIKKGRMLFYDEFLGRNSRSCASCHKGDKKFMKKMKKYPLYDSYKRRFFFLKDVIITCINGALDGPLLKKDDSRLSDIEVFLKNMEEIEDEEKKS